MEKNYLHKKINSSRNRITNISCKELLVILSLFVFSGVFGKIGGGNTPWLDKGLKNEIQNKRSRTSKHFIKADGLTASAFVSPFSIHYKDASGSWAEISTDIVSNSGSNSITHPFSAEFNSIKTYFPSNPLVNYILLSSEQGSYKEKVSAINFLDASGQVISSLPLSNNIKVNIEKNKIEYTGFYPGLTLSYSLGNDFRKFDLIVNSPSFFSLAPSNAQYIAIQEEFVSDQANTRIEEREDYVALNVNGTEVFGFSKPVAYDSNTSDDTPSNGNMSFVKTGNSIVLMSAFDLNWLKSGSRIFPIHLDPIVNYFPQVTTMWAGYQTSNINKTSGFLRLTTNTTASWAKFDLATLPTGATIIQANYYGFHYTTTGAAKLAEIRGLGALDPVPAAAGTLFTQSYGGVLYATNYTFGSGTFTWNAALLNSAALTDIAAAAGNWIGLGISFLSGNTTFMYQYGINGTSTQNCYLEVDYTLTPCSTVPGANSVIAPNYTLCPNTLHNLSLASGYTVSGIGYQWESSTLSPLGPFTAISGATNNILSGNSATVTTWYNVVITCSNVSGSASVTPGTVTIATTVTNSVPYGDSFETVFVNNDLPNCSWLASNPVTVCRTYTTAQLNNRIPRTGNNFASFATPTATDGAYFYTNGIQMFPGITYSVAVWYTTDGSIGWSELSLLLGSSQSTTGLTNVATITGGSINGLTYQLLSNTITVSTAGIYYVAVKCIRQTGAQFLTFDDLSVTIPCSLNSPSITLVTSPSNICSGQPVNISAAGADTYSWSNGSQGSAISVIPFSSVNYSVTGTNTLSGCSVEMPINLAVNPTPILSVFANSQAICLGSSLTLQAGGADTYTWSNGSLTSSTTVSPATTTNYTVLGSNLAGCIGSAVRLVVVNPLPVVTATSSAPNELCVNETATLTGGGALNYQWKNNSIIILTQQAFVSPNVSTVYTLTGTDANGCSASTQVAISVSQCVGLNELNGELEGIKVYPNPFSDYFVVEMNNGLTKQIDVIDVTGRIILTQTSTDDKISLSTRELAAGVYYLKVSSANAVNVTKVVKD